MTQTSYAADYAHAILNRARIPMEPVVFEPDWADRPRKWRHYPGLESVPLPDAAPLAGGGTVAAGLHGPGGQGAWTLPLLGGMLRDTYGLLGRRLAVQCNTDAAALPSYAQANWHRGTASGGGLYPVTLTWVAGPGGPLLPGVYHYAPQQHALRPLLLGDVTDELRRALSPDSPADDSRAGDFLVLGVKYWQNAFKYNTFSFQAVSMDVGAAAQSLRTWARAAGLDASAELFFDEARLARLLGVEETEGLFAVIPAGAARGPAGAPAGPGGARVAHRDVERSRRTTVFDRVAGMQTATRQEGPGRPTADALAPAAVRPAHGRGAVQVQPLPPPAPLDRGLRDVLRRRRSSFGRFDARTALPAAELHAVLDAMTAAARDTTGRDDLVGLFVFVNHVEGVPAGTYVHGPDGLGRLDPEPPGAFLQRTYFLSNYNLEQAAAVVVPTARTGAVLDAVGGRGYRLVSAAIGALAQNAYVASAALGVGCGVALGFDNVSYVEHLGLPEGENPQLVVLLGHERPGAADVRHEIV